MVFDIIIIVTIGLLLSAVAFIVALFLILIIVCKPILLQNESNIMILSYMILNMIAICAYFIPLFTVFSLHTNWYTCNLLFSLAFAMGIISCLHLSIITLHRLFAIEKPFLYKRICTSRNVAVIMIAIWIIPIGFYMAAFIERYSVIQANVKPNITSCIFNVNFEFGKNISADKNMLRTTIEIYHVIVGIIPTCIIISCYTRFYCIALKKKLRIENNGNRITTLKSSIYNRKRVLYQMVALTAIFVISYPVSGIIASVALRKNRINLSLVISRIGVVLQLIYSITVPIFYVKYTSDLKAEVNKIFGRGKSRRIGALSSRSGTNLNSEFTQKISVFFVASRRGNLPAVAD
ncbi:5-hydroxytryptamine receptor 1B [Trichoplax sp. H2]|nr:5-hydroxytryptamine receptor 1B [Trichoplax sp. H2]|eukprot:RDD44058.1 5-hydroxytryptamine receptor 1B [Trichoplax sp. H2]